MNNNIRYIPYSESILCKNGWQCANSVCINDEVYGIDGKLHTVKDVILKENQDIYYIGFSNGSIAKVGQDSVLRVCTKKQEENMRKFNDERFMYLSVNDILNNNNNSSIFFDRNITQHKYSCLHVKPIITEKINLIINPYLLGLLLGDGGFTMNITTFTNPEEDILKEFDSMISDIGMESHYKHFENHVQIYICSKGCDHQNKMNTILKELNLKGLDSRQKFIPDIYKKSSVNDRLLLLSGIINTDGSVDDSGIINICTYSYSMYKGIKELLESVGLVVSCSKYNRTSKDSTKKYKEEIEYRIRILEKDYSIFKLSNKHLCKLKNRKKFTNKIINIDKCGSETAIGFLLDDNQRIVTNDYIAI